MLVEELDIGLYVADRNGLAVTVVHVDAVETGAHTAAVSLGGTAGQCQQKRKYKN